jgi:hypothetical protein
VKGEKIMSTPSGATARVSADEIVVADDVVGAEVGRPLPGLLAGRGADDGQVGERPRELDDHRPDAARRAHDEQAPGLTLPHPEPVEQRLPGGDRRQRERRGLGEGQCPGLRPGDALVDRVVLRVRPLPGDRAGVVDLVADREQGDLVADGGDDPRRVVAEDLRAALRVAGVDLGVDGVDRHRADLDDQVARTRRRDGELDLIEGTGGGVVGQGAHRLGHGPRP